MSLGSNISHKRKSLKLSQEYVAEQLGTSRKALSKWETNQSEPSTNNLINLAELFDSDIKELVSPEEYVNEKKDAENQIKQDRKDINMQMSAAFGRILMLTSFLGYIGAFSDPSSYQLPNWYLTIWWGGIFLIGAVLTFIGARDYFIRKSGPKNVIWLDLLFVFSYFLYGLLPFETGINGFIIMFYGIGILSIQNIKFFIPTWRKSKSFIE
ncbi:helix-turn-helix domain-containing protein [Alkalicoccobacillus murimartini]|uniref:Transcriptional regulator with XRE-family HTH domain n=1 Tax=Alkalicoccobacillus murimartini TaxID=171685 RepID=A0ABT9YDA3_9BACI|nr:helix-turn-helix transcriptional regulator [Alkalicoccobacillus murimartini]MDQ0205706.1 transcriptional regulator with XRE-family HTH domain [Alkalicoccobacillus murimartini]